jgi:hypothetical protein
LSLKLRTFDRHLRIVVAALTIASMYGFPVSVADAQVEDAATRASARSLFEEGVSLAEAEKWSDAEEKFRRSLSLHPSQVVAFNLATALTELGRLVEASELLEEIRRDRGTTAQMKRRVDTTIETLRRKLAWITVELRGHAGSTATVDGHVLPDAALGVPRAVDPGARVIEARLDGRVVWTRTVTLSEGQSEEVVVEVPTSTPVAPATTATPAVPTPQETAALANGAPNADHVAPTESSASESSGPWLWIGIGGAVAVTAVVAVLLASSGDSDPAPAFSGSLGNIAVPAQ